MAQFLSRRSRLTVTVAVLAISLENIVPAQAEDWQARLRALENGAVPRLELAQVTEPFSETPRDFDIPAQPLAGALRAFGQQSDLQVTADAALIAGMSGSTVRGRMSPRAALKVLLTGTGLGAEISADRTVLLTRSPEGAVRLDPIPVEGTADRQNAVQSPQGFVATQSSVATKTDTPILETPQSISVVTRDEMDIRNAQSDAQVLLYTPGVWAQPFGGDQNQSNPFFYIRGFSSAFGGSYVDGLVSPVNYRYEPFGLERVDIFRGPTSTLYGQSDPGGMVNRTTKRPPAEFSGEIQMQGGTYDRKQGAIDIGGPLGTDAVLGRITGLIRDADAPIDYNFGYNQPDERKYIAPSLTLRPTEDTSFTVLASLLDDLIGQESVFRNENGKLTHTSLNQNDVGVFDYRQEMIGYAFEHRFNPHLQVHQNLRYSHMDADTLSLFQGAIDSANNLVDRSSFGFEEERHDFAIDTNLQADFATGPIAHRILGGVDYQHLRDWVTFSFGVAPPLNYKDPDYGQDIDNAEPFMVERYLNENVGVYLQEQATLFDRVIVTFGGRHDWARGTVEDELFGAPKTEAKNKKFTYRGGISYLFDFGLAPYFSYTTSFLPTGGTSVSGTQFKPTTGQQFEVGLKYKPEDFNGFFAVSLYDLRRQNALSADPDNPGFNVQTGEVRSRGVEFEANVSLTEGLNVSASYAFNDAEITKDTVNRGQRPTLTPKHLASAWVDYTFQETLLRGLTLGGGVRYVSDTFGNLANDLRNDDYLLFDAVVRYDFGGLYDPLEGTSLSVNVSNIADEDYAICYTNFDCNWGAGRTVMATLGYRW